MITINKPVKQISCKIAEMTRVATAFPVIHNLKRTNTMHSSTAVKKIRAASILKKIPIKWQT
jgi:hypothetical protein